MKKYFLFTFKSFIERDILEHHQEQYRVFNGVKSDISHTIAREPIYKTKKIIIKATNEAEAVQKFIRNSILCGSDLRNMYDIEEVNLYK